MPLALRLVIQIAFFGIGTAFRYSEVKRRRVIGGILQVVSGSVILFLLLAAWLRH
jgi:hypothetical protein